MMNTMREVCHWKLMKCKHCAVWTHAYNEQEDRYAVLLNNRIKDSNKEQSLGLLTRSYKAEDEKQEVRVPILKKIKL